MKDTQYFRQLRAKAIALINQQPGISLANLAMKLGIAPYQEAGNSVRVSCRVRGLRDALKGYCEEKLPQFAKSAELPNIYPLGYQFDQPKSNKAVRSIPCKVYRRGDEGYERVYSETVRKSA